MAKSICDCQNLGQTKHLFRPVVINPFYILSLSSGAGCRPPVLTKELLAVGAAVAVDLGAVGEERDHAAAADAPGVGGRYTSYEFPRFIYFETLNFSLPKA